MIDRNFEFRVCGKVEVIGSDIRVHGVRTKDCEEIYDLHLDGGNDWVRFKLGGLTFILFREDD